MIQAGAIMENNKSLNERVIGIKDCREEIDKLIKEYKPFIASIVESHLGHYAEYGVDDELSIALIAFNEAIKKYDMRQRQLSFLCPDCYQEPAYRLLSKRKSK
jgi:DNA-directed RNA polymerase specialized sigma subunit